MALALQRLKQFEAIAERTDLFVIQAWRLHWVSPSTPKAGLRQLLQTFPSTGISKPPQEITLLISTLCKTWQ